MFNLSSYFYGRYSLYLASWLLEMLCVLSVLPLDARRGRQPLQKWLSLFVAWGAALACGGGRQVCAFCNLAPVGPACQQNVRSMRAGSLLCTAIFLAPGPPNAWHVLGARWMFIEWTRQPGSFWLWKEESFLFHLISRKGRLMQSFLQQRYWETTVKTTLCLKS